jgi:hypothetical protein
LLKNHIKKWFEQGEVHQAKNYRQNGVNNVNRNEFPVRSGVGENSQIGIHEDGFAISTTNLRKNVLDGILILDGKN